MNRLWRTVVEIGRSIKSELLSTLGTFITIFLAMLLPGIIGILALNLDRVQTDFKKNLTMNVFLKDGFPDTRAASLGSQIKSLLGVVDAVYISKEQALANMQNQFGEGMLSGLDENPLPASFAVKISENTLRRGVADSLAARIAQMPEVDDVVFAGAMLARLERIARAVYLLGLAIAILAAVAAVFIVANTIRIAIADKRQTIKVMELVGATRTYIMAPFISLGAILGIAGAALAAAVLYWASQYISKHLIQASFPGVNYIAYFIVAGLLLGVIGSLVAVGRHLRI